MGSQAGIQASSERSMDAFKSAALALKPALSCRGWQGQGVILSDAPVTESSSAVLDGIVCGPPALSPDGDRVLVESMPSAMGED